MLVLLLCFCIFFYYVSIDNLGFFYVVGLLRFNKTFILKVCCQHVFNFVFFCPVLLCSPFCILYPFPCLFLLDAFPVFSFYLISFLLENTILTKFFIFPIRQIPLTHLALHLSSLKKQTSKVFFHYSLECKTTVKKKETTF